MARPIRSTVTRDGEEELESRVQYWADQTLAEAPERDGRAAGGDRLTVTDASGQVTAITEYPGPAGDGGGITTSYRYDGADNLVGWARDTRVWTARYDMADRLVESTDPDTGRTVTFYRPDGLAQLTRTGGSTDADGVTAWTHGTWTKYDQLGRSVEVRDITADGVLGEEPLTRTEYDPDGRFGQIAASESRTRFGDHEVTLRTETTEWDQFARPVTSRSSIAGLPGMPDNVPTSVDTHVELTVAGDVTSVDLPAAGGLPEQRVRTSYTSTGLPHMLHLGDRMVAENRYTNTGRLSQRAWGTGAAGVGVLRQIGWDETLDAPTRVQTALTGVAATGVQDDRYTWDAAGNLLEVADRAADPTRAAVEDSKRCNLVDGFGRLTAAYSAAVDAECARKADDVPGADSEGWLTGAAPTFTTWTFDGADRVTGRVEGVHQGGLLAAANSYGYTYDPAHPNRLAALVTSGADPATISYSYTGAGELAASTVLGTPATSTRNPGFDPLAGGAASKATGQGWTYDALGQPVSVSAGGKSTSMAWGPDGGRWLVSDGQSTTWYSPAGQITWNAGQVTTASRSHGLGGAVVATTSVDGAGAVRTVWAADDLSGDAIIQADPDTLAADKGWMRQHYGTHGQLIGRTGDAAFAWAGTRAWQGLPVDQADPAGVTNVGARMFDTVTQLFTTPDPAQDPYTPAAANPYTYAQNNAASIADPDGLWGFSIRKAVASVAKKVTTAVRSAVSTTKKVASTAVKAVASKAKSAVKAVKRTYNSARKIVRDTTAKAKEVAKTVKKKVKDTAKSAAKTVKKAAANPTVRKAAGIVAGVVVGVAAAAAAAVCATGVGCIALGLAVSGAASSIADGLVNGHSAAQIARDATIGAVLSLATLGIGKAVGPMARAAAGKVGEAVRPAATRVMAALGRGCNSFTAGTRVVMADGTNKAIAKIRIGDKVKATIPGQPPGVATVSDTIRHGGPHRMVAITVAVLALAATPATAHATEQRANAERATATTGQIQTTAEHPIHVTTNDDDGTWVNAADLQPGDQLTSGDPTHTITVNRVDTYTQDLTAYNLTTTPQHTYYIHPNGAPPTTQALVHNAASSPHACQVPSEHRARVSVNCGFAGLLEFSTGFE